MLSQRANQIAMQEMKDGSNCCQSVVIAACHIWTWEFRRDFGCGFSFRRGMHSGCPAEALTGMIIASGLKGRVSRV